MMVKKRRNLLVFWELCERNKRQLNIKITVKWVLKRDFYIFLIFSLLYVFWDIKLLS